jgi:hypothetical protein
MTLDTRNATMPMFLRRTLVPVSVAGLAGVLLTFVLGFEVPNTALAVLSAAMVLAAPFAVLLHLMVTTSLSPEEKRAWWNDFGSPEIWSAMSEYLSSGDLTAAAQRRALDAEERRVVRKT